MNHKDLDVWKSAMLPAEKVYRETVDFPNHEQFGMTSQLRRAAVFVPANIAESSARKGNKELIQFLYISLGSLADGLTKYLKSKEYAYSPFTIHDSPSCSKH